MEPRPSFSGIVALTIVACAFAVAAALAAAVLSSQRGEAGALAAEASMLAECGLERALCEIAETGTCRSADHEVRCGGDGEGDAAFVRRTTLSGSGPDGGVIVEVAVSWHSPAGSGMVVTRGRCRPSGAVASDGAR